MAKVQTTRMVHSNTLQSHIEFIQQQWLSKTQFSVIARNVFALQRGLTGDRTLIAQTYMNDSEYLSAYLAYYWPVSYTQIQHCLLEAQNSGIQLFQTANQEPVNQALTILDFGSGPAPMSTGLLDFIACQYPEIQSITLYLADVSMSAMNAGMLILKHSAYPFTVNIQTVCTDTFEKIFNISCKFDFVIFGHSFNELTHRNPNSFDHIHHFFMKMVKTSGAVLFIEPALLATSRNLIALRNFLLNNHTVACTLPCPTDLRCSVPDAGPSHTCHDEFTWNIPPSVARLAQANALNRASIKMTWFLMFRACNKKPSSANNTYRVVSEPLLNKAGRIRYLLCGSSGRIACSASKTDTHAQALGFFSLQRGDTILLENPEQRETGFGIADTTRITVIKHHTM